MASAKLEAQINKLRSAWEKAVQKEKHADALAALRELEKLDPDEAKWVQRIAECHRRLGQREDAENAYVRAMDLYVKGGFLPHALAMAKSAISLNAARTDLLARIEAPRAPSLAATLAKAGPPKVAPPPPQNAPLAAAARPLPPPEHLEPMSSPMSRAIPLLPSEPSDLETRFDDAPDARVNGLELHDVAPQLRRGPEPPPTPSTAPEEYVIELDELDVALVREPTHAELDMMASSSFFRNLPPQALQDLAAKAELVELEAGEWLFRRNDPADALYILTEGVARVLIVGADNLDVRLIMGDVCGEGCLLDDGVRQADVRVEKTLVALKIPRDSLERVVASHPEVEKLLFELLVRRLVGNVMQTSPLFISFEPLTKLELAKLFEVRRAPEGTVLAETGKLADGLYVVLAGNLEVENASVRATIARGAIFGQASLLSRAVMTETIRAASESVVLRLGTKQFGMFAALYPPALMHLTEVASEPVRVSLRAGR